MRVLRHILPLGALIVTFSQAAIHNLFVGNLRPPASIHSLEFNDETNDFKLLRTMEASAPHAWIAFDHSKQTIYGASLLDPLISSYPLLSPTLLSSPVSIPFSGTCTNKTSAFVQAMNTPPHFVLSASWPGPGSCGTAFSVYPNGSLHAALDTWSYVNSSGVHGLALREIGGVKGEDVAKGKDVGEKVVLYSADLNGNAVWTHTVDKESGKVRELGRWKVKEGWHPRHVAARRKGGWVYVVMEADNSVVEFETDEETGEVKKEGGRWVLWPEGEGRNSSMYWSAEVLLSRSEKYLWATARAQRDTNFPGYISTFLLGDNGRIVKRMFMVETTTVGGWANAINPAPWSDEYAVMADHPLGYVQMWRMEGRREGVDGVEYETARAVARVDVADGGCCANAVWYN